MNRFQILRLLAAPILLPLTVPSQAAPPTAIESPERTRIRASSIQADINYLASDALTGRESGTHGNDLAARYVAAAFMRAGLKPVGTSRQSDASGRIDGSGYYQPFTITAGVTTGKSNRLSIALAGKERAYRAGTDYRPALVSARGTVTGTLAFAGAGIVTSTPRRNDFAAIAPKGKVVMVLADPPPGGAGEYPDNLSKVISARDQGAAALLIVQPEPRVWPRVGTDRVTTDAGIPVLMISRDAATSLIRTESAELAEAALSNPDHPFSLKARVTAQADIRKVTKTTANIVGLLEGADPALKNEIVVIGAHMDHLGMGGPNSLAASKAPAIHHGADDNASGTAAVMALAAYFADSGAVSTRPKRSILFMAFSGEEMGLLGSMHYVKHPIFPLERTMAMLNMDMVGRMQDNKLVVSGSGTSPSWNGLIDSVNETARFNVARSESGFGASDQQSFYIAKIPVLFFFTGLHSDYHRPSDTADKINAADEARVVQMVADCAERIANANERPAFQQIAAAADSGPARFRVSLGSIPDYTAEVEGVQLSGIRPGSPADKAGLKAGDIIIKFGDKTIRNVQEYTVALGAHKPGDTVHIVVKRGGETLTVTATLAESKR